jgi:coenzyme F420 hydrogenase subunit beta
VGAEASLSVTPFARPGFRELMNEVVLAGRCIECASCVVACPYNQLELDALAKPRRSPKKGDPADFCPVAENQGCDICAAVCPRLAPDKAEIADRVFGEPVARLREDGFGPYRQILVARASEQGIREVGQDGGVVTALLAWGLERGRFDGAIVSRVGAAACQPEPYLATSREEVIAAAGSWYTYCANPLAIAEARERGLERVAFVGVPCQTTPVAKFRHTARADWLAEPVRPPRHAERQGRHLDERGERIALSVGLLCSEVFTFDLMTEVVAGELSIPLADVANFNVKGEVLIRKRDGELVRLPLVEAQTYARPECQHCDDFSAELADISAGGVGSDGWTIVITRTAAGQEAWDALVADGWVETMPIESHERSLAILKRLARKQRERVPVPAGGRPRFWA